MSVAASASIQTPPASFLIPARRFIRRAKERRKVWKFGDSTGQSSTGGEMLLRSLIARRLLRREVLADDERFVGLLLPPSVGGAIANFALTLDRRVAVNLNYTSSPQVIESCLEQCGIRHVLTTEKVLSKLGFRPNCELVMLDELRQKLRLQDKLAGFWQANVMSAEALEKKLGLDQESPEELLTVIFTSGSTGKPKGVMLSHYNVGANIDSFNEVLHFKSTDTLIGILPFFHSFGYTVSLWGAASLNIGAAYHFNPLEARQVGKLCEKFRGTCLVSTPTFLRAYLRRVSEEEFKMLEVVVTGAEKLPADLATAFQERFGVLPVEGYGSTELAPVAAVNVPLGRSRKDGEVDAKPGTVGRPLPNVTAKVCDLETGEELGPNQPGMLWITGPNVMRGYLERPDLTEEVLVDGWYKTGDVATLDEDGFITITGRISRFSKIGGEMIPHLPLEEKLNELMGAAEEGTLMAAVTAISDPKKGERLVVLHTKTQKTPDELLAELKSAGFTALYLPARDSFVEVDEIPVLGTGKLDLRGLKQTAEEMLLGESS